MCCIPLPCRMQLITILTMFSSTFLTRQVLPYAGEEGNGAIVAHDTSRSSIQGIDFSGCKIRVAMHSCLLSMQVLVCPPESCLTQDKGCSGFEFASSAKGKPGKPLICSAIDEMAEVGTTIQLKYMVQDFVYPGAVSSTIITRMVMISEPCGQDEFFCEDDRTCSSVRCCIAACWTTTHCSSWLHV